MVSGRWVGGSVVGGFNKTQSTNINTTEGLNLFSLMSSDGFSQLIHEPTYILVLT